MAASIVVIAMGVAAAGAASAWPGHGGGGGGGMGAGMGMGHGFGDSRMSGGPMGLSNGGNGVGGHSAVTTLDRGNVDTALTKALAKSGVAIPGGDLKTACASFRNLGGCVSALHVANNLALPGGFTALKGLMTGPNPISLGKAIQQLDPSADAGAQTKQANGQAHKDLDAASSTVRS